MQLLRGTSRSSSCHLRWFRRDKMSPSAAAPLASRRQLSFWRSWPMGRSCTPSTEPFYWSTSQQETRDCTRSTWPTTSDTSWKSSASASEVSLLSERENGQIHMSLFCCVIMSFFIEVILNPSSSSSTSSHVERITSPPPSLSAFIIPAVCVAAGLAAVALLLDYLRRSKKKGFYQLPQSAPASTWAKATRYQDVATTSLECGHPFPTKWQTPHQDVLTKFHNMDIKY